jgi:hypothetical protein
MNQAMESNGLTRRSRAIREFRYTSAWLWGTPQTIVLIFSYAASRIGSRSVDYRKGWFDFQFARAEEGLFGGKRRAGMRF